MAWEGLFNLCLEGSGHAVLNSSCPIKELYEITLDNDCIKIDGNNAVCWSRSLAFTVERSGKSLIGSAASGEGLVNVYRGTGKILVAPLEGGGFTASGTAHTAESSSKSALVFRHRRTFLIGNYGAVTLVAAFHYFASTSFMFK